MEDHFVDITEMVKIESGAMSKGEKWIVFLLLVLNIVVIATVLEAKRRLGNISEDVESFKGKLDKFGKIGNWFK